MMVSGNLRRASARCPPRLASVGKTALTESARSLCLENQIWGTKPRPAGPPHISILGREPDGTSGGERPHGTGTRIDARLLAARRTNGREGPRPPRRRRPGPDLPD